MARAEDTELIDVFEEFYRSYYRNEIGELAQKYPTEQKSLYIDWGDLYRFDPDLADDFRTKPDQLREYAEEALRLYDLPVDVSLGQAHVRVRGLPESTEIRDIRADNRGSLLSVQGIVRKATEVRPKVTNAAFECQRCGTLTRIPQSDGGFQEPHECQGCERQGPFRVNFDQSEFVDAQKLRVQESPEGLRGGETPQAIDVNIEDDITGEVTAGDHVTVTGILKLDQQGSDREKSPMFDTYMTGLSVEIEDEQFEEMDISESDKTEIVELSNDPEVYEKMVGAIAPSIYGYETEKLAMALQLFSGVTKHLPDGSRLRGDLHMLLIGDPGTGKCLSGDTEVTLADGRRVPVRDLVETNLEDPKPVDDGVYDEADIALPSMTEDGEIEERRASRVWKREAPEEMYRVRTASGRVVEVTPSHPLFVQSGGEFVPRKAAELREGEFIATPQRLETTAATALDVDYRRSQAPNAVRLDLPDAWTPWLARLVGYVVAEGYATIREDNTGSVTVTNEDQEILDDVTAAFDRLGLPYAERDGRDGKDASTVACTASEFVSFLEHLEPALLEGSAAQRVPDAIQAADREIQAAFLRAYVDGEGHVSATERELAVASMSRELLEDVRSLLLSFGIQGSLGRRENGSYRLRISGEDFGKYAAQVGFVTERKADAAAAFDGVPGNTNTDVVPGVGSLLRSVRERLALAQGECGLPRPTYQHYEVGDRNPSRTSLATVVDAFENRLSQLRRTRERVADGSWDDIVAVRDDLGLSQADLSERMEVTQTAVSYYEREDVVPDGGNTEAAREVVLGRLDEALSAGPDIQRLRTLVDGDIYWDRIETIETVEPDDDWVYDLEVPGTHNYLSNGVVSHNSMLLQYIRQIAPRSVYTSGKGSSAAGLCVTGDTLVHTSDGFREIRDLAEPHHPDPVDENEAAEVDCKVYTFDRGSGSVQEAIASHVWRMPEKPCRQIETAHGKELEASVNTPVLVCGEAGMEWCPISEIESGDHVAVPSYAGVERTTPSPREFFEFTGEKLKLTDRSVGYLRRRLQETFGTLRDAATALDLSEDFIYDTLSNRHVPLDKLDRVLDAIDASREDITVRRAMLRHGNSITIPDTFGEDLLYLTGLVFGDGDISVSRRSENRGCVRISNSDVDLLRDAARIIEEVFDKSVDIEHQEDKVPCIRLYSATVARFFQNLGMETPEHDLRLNPRLTTAQHGDAFLRGLFDADGSVSVREEGVSSVQFSTISGGFAEQVQLMLETYGIRATRRERDRQRTYERADGHEIESKSTQHHLAVYGRDIDVFADRVGFESDEKSMALDEIVRAVPRRGERLPVGDALLRADGAGGPFYQNLYRGDDPSRERALELVDDRELGDIESLVREVADAGLVWDEVVATADTGTKEVFDLTVPTTHNFFGNGLVTHNTAAAVRDDFGDGQQWTLEAGALVLADQGIAAVDELDKMRCVTGDTLVHLGDGRVTRIEDLAREAEQTGQTEELPNGKTVRGVDVDAWTMTDDGQLVRRPVTAVHEYDAPETLTRVTLRTGERVTTTDDHPFFVFDDGVRKRKPAAALDGGDWVYVPREVPTKAADGGVTDANMVTGDGSGTEELSPAFAAVLGYLAGDGNIYYDEAEGVYGVRFTNAEEELLADFERACREAFDATPVRPPSEQRDDGVETVRLHGKAYAEAVLDAGMNLETYDGKRLPEGVTEASRAAKASFLRALADSEGSVEARNVRVFSSSYELLMGAKHLLLEFGVSSQIQTRSRESGRDVYVLAVTDADSLAAFDEFVGFTLDRKQQALDGVVESVSGTRTVLDVIPEAGGLLSETRGSLRLHQSECGLDDATYCNFENEQANVSVRAAREILGAFRRRKRTAQADATRVAAADWADLARLRERYHVSQAELADGTEYSQQQVSQQWGTDTGLQERVRARLETIIRAVAETELGEFESLVYGDVKWRRVEAVETAVADGNDDQLRLLRRQLGEVLGCESDSAEQLGRQLLATEPAAETWDALRMELERHGVSFQDIAAELDVAGSTVSRWFGGVVETERFDEVRSVSLDRIGAVRREVSALLDRIEARGGEKVYDLTVAGTHNFLANGMVVHNSEDRSAMHEALEQQSYHPDTELLLADGRRVDVGEFVDSRMADRPEDVVDGVDCEILPVDDVTVHSVDTDDGSVEKLPVDRVSRHEAPEEFVRVTFSNGREVTVTPEHPMFVDDEGIGTVEARNLEEGAFVPAPRKLPNSAEPVGLDDEPRVGTEKDVTLPGTVTPDLGEVLGLLVAEGHSYAGSAREVGFSDQDERLLARMGRLMREVFGLESTDTTNAAGTVTKRWVSTKLYRWFESNVPELMETAREKRIPAAVLGSSEEVIRRFLVGAFAGDGGVESEAMSFSTASEGLARDYADALSKVGVASRVHHDSAEDSWKVYVMGDSTARFVERVVEPADNRYEEAKAFAERSAETPRHHDVLPTSAAHELRTLRKQVGLSLTGQYRPSIDEGYGVQVGTVEAELADLRERVDAVRDAVADAASLAEVRDAVGWSGRELAERVGETTSTVHYAEEGGYDEERREALTAAAREAVEDALADAEERIADLETRAELRYYRVTDVETVPNDGEKGCEWVYDVTVEPTNTFVSAGAVLHNSISVSKAGINATLKSRCSLLGAANPKYGRFDQYEPIGEQIDLEPALISRFDLIFTVTDQPDQEEDARLAEHILQTNYAGELNTHRTEVTASNHTEEEVETVTEEVAPTIDPDLLRKYVAYAKRNCFPTMTEEAKAEIQDFYVDLRAEGTGDDAPVPVTARKLEALVRLAEASARVRLSDTVEKEDAERATDIARSSMEDIGMDPETGEFDADVVETGTSKSQRDRVKSILDLVGEIEEEYDEGAPVDVVVERAEEQGIESSKAEHEVEQLKQKGEVYTPTKGHLRTT